MEAIAHLQRLYFLHKFGAESMIDGINWAIERLQLNQEGDDLDIVLLASVTKEEEAVPLAERIIERYCGHSVLDEQLAAGKYVTELHKMYLAKTESIESLESKILKLYCRLGYPDWLVMLSRNCELATDISVFRIPFEQEFQYIAGLWSNAGSRQEFEEKYRREVSNQHDFRNC